MDLSPRSMVVFYALFIATILQLVPAYDGWIDWKPNFILTVVMVLIVNKPQHFGVTFAALVGLFADGVFGTTVGQFMLIFTLCGGIVLLLSRWTHYFAFFYRFLVIFCISLFAAFAQTVLGNLQGSLIALDYLPGMALMSALLLPLAEKFIGVSRES